ncbi:MAG: CHAT domain-containing protein [Lentimicrobiaceae bacterium]|nr:CHAT domain-containing protein [Lentimicrobiaceae bacterium]
MHRIRLFLLLACLTGFLCLPIFWPMAQQGSVKDQGSHWMQKGERAFQEARYDSAIRCFEEAANAFARPEQPAARARALMRQAECHRIISHIDKAYRLFLEARGLIEAHRIQDPMMLGDLGHLESNIVSDQGDFVAAIRIMKEAIALKARAHPRPDSSISMSLNNIGFNFFYLSDYDSAKHYYSLALNRALQDRERYLSDVATFMQNISLVHSRKGDLDSALWLMQESMAMREKILPPGNPDLAHSYLNIATIYSAVGNYEQAMAYSKKAVDIFYKSLGPDAVELSIQYTSIANHLIRLGDREKSLEYHRKSLQISYQNESLRSVSTSSIMAIANHYFAKGDYQASLHYLQDSKIALDNPGTRISYYISLARTLGKLGQQQEALSYVRQANKLTFSTNGPNHIDNGYIFSSLGGILLEMGNATAALQYYDQALAVYKHYFGDRNPRMYYVHSAYASAYNRLGMPDKALAAFQEAIICASASFDDTSVFRNPRPSTVLMASFLVEPLAGKALIFKDKYDKTKDLRYLEASLDALRLSADAIDLVRNQYTDVSKANISAEQRLVYLNGVEVARTMFQLSGRTAYLEEAFQFAERSKYAALLSSMRDIQARQVGRIPDSLSREEQEIKDRIIAYQKLIYDEQLKPEPDQDKLTRWEGQLFQSKRDLESMVARLEAAYPHYHELKYRSDVVHPHEIQQQLGDEEAMVAYLKGDTNLFAFYITRDDLRLVSTPTDSSLAIHIETLRNAMTSQGIANNSSASFARQAVAAHALFKTLLEPGYDLLQGKDLLIIPDEMLGYLSFDILLNKPPDTASYDYSKLPYLIRDHNISYAYLATLQYRREVSHSKRATKAIAFAPNYTGIREAPSENLLSLRGMEKFLLPIKHAKMEMDLLKDKADARIFTDDAANESNFKALSPEYDIIHLAMHSVVDNENPMLSKLVFTIPSEVQEEDGLLNAFEIYNLNLRARMLVLSACNTGYGQMQKGEGIISIGRAFMYAGIPGIIMTLWEIEDKSGYDIMTHFYKYLSQGKDRDESIRLAKLDYLQAAGKLHAHPYFWAAYINIGDNSPVYTKNRHTTWVVVVCLLALLLIAGGYLRGRRWRES